MLDFATQQRGLHFSSESHLSCGYELKRAPSHSQSTQNKRCRRQPETRRSQVAAAPAGEQTDASTTGASSPALTALQSQQTAKPVLSGGGGGIFFFWQLGIVKYLEEHYDLTQVDLRGASAGALLATIAACNIDPKRALDSAHRLAVDAKLWDRKLKLAGVWGDLVRAWLYELLPPNASDLVRGRLQLVVTDVWDRFKQAAISDFANNQELIEANMASVHVPFFLDFKPFCWIGGRPYVDGSLADFMRGDNSDLLTCEGKAVVLDYFDDTQLNYKRMDFLKLPSHEGAIELMNKGYAFAQRTAATGEYDRKLGSVRRAAKLPRA